MNQTNPFKEGVDIPTESAIEEWNFILERGKEFLSDTAFVTGKKFEKNDIDILKQFYQEVFDHQKNTLTEKGAVFNESLREHLSLAERIGELAADKLQIDKYELTAVLLTHDLGRLFSHRRGRNNLIENKISKELNFSENFTKLLPPDSLRTELDQKSVNTRLQTITTENSGIVGLVELIDVMAKWKTSQKQDLRKSDDLIAISNVNQATPNKATMWPSEYKRQTKIASETGQNAVDTKYSFLINWFETKTGCSLDEFIKEVEQDLKDRPLPSKWQ